MHILLITHRNLHYFVCAMFYFSSALEPRRTDLPHVVSATGLNQRTAKNKKKTPIVKRTNSNNLPVHQAIDYTLCSYLHHVTNVRFPSRNRETSARLWQEKWLTDDEVSSDSPGSDFLSQDGVTFTLFLFSKPDFWHPDSYLKWAGTDESLFHNVFTRFVDSWPESHWLNEADK